MTKYHDQILEHLEFAIRRDAAKGGDGWRSTAEVAERLSVKTPSARRALYELLDIGLLDYRAGLGSALEWHLAEPDDGEREPMNDNEPGALAVAA